MLSNNRHLCPLLLFLLRVDVDENWEYRKSNNINKWVNDVDKTAFQIVKGK